MPDEPAETEIRPSRQPDVPETEKQSSVVVSPDEEVYSAWSGGERRLIVFMAATAAVFSPLSAYIYFPIFNVLAADLKVSSALINITVTTYMVVQGIAPTIIAGASDTTGRRPVYILCFIIYFFANLGLALQRDYVALALLRCIQSAGSSSTVSLASAVVADIAPPSRRGTYSAFTLSAVFIGPSIGPAIGGALSNLGWPAVFWFLVISSGVFLLLIVIALPETCRQVVGDGSALPPRWNTSLVSILHRRHRARSSSVIGSEVSSQRPILAHSKAPTRMVNIFESTTVLANRELSIITIGAGLPYAAFFAVNASIPSVFAALYSLNSFQIGLCFLTVGAGALGSCLLQGRLVDWNFRRYCLRLGLPMNTRGKQKLHNFPIERARLEIALPATVLCAVAVLGYGWSIDQNVSIAAPLVFVFFTSLTSMLSLNVLMILVIDIWDGRPAVAAAGANLVRCLLGAAAVASVAPMTDSVGRGWAFTIMALLALGSVPLLFVCMSKGMGWRHAREARSMS